VPSDGRGGGVLHFVIATPGEGTSTIAREFALLATTTGHRHTLLDADRRNPQTARSFGCPMTRGLIDCLSGAARSGTTSVVLNQRRNYIPQLLYRLL
jgi:Mrp family chromosome partitioning ATPase